MRCLEVFLIKPSKYDEDGYVLRHLRSVLPNNTLATLYALTEHVRASGKLGALSLRAHLCDESLQTLPERRICRLARRHDTKVLVCLVGAQTNQFPRAVDLARRFRARGIDVMIGGSHVSGTLALQPDVPLHLQQLLDEGITLVKGEVEDIWEMILQAAASGRTKPIYDSINDKPDLFEAPVPRLDSELTKKFVYRHFATLDTSRGCPFTCSFCTIINTHGRKMRFRNPAHVAAAIEENYRTTGTHHYFFTDDNFTRSKNWKAMFHELIRLREDAGIPVRFLMQVDVLSHKLPGFITLAKQAGCFQVFAGLESLNPDNLIDAGKPQNKCGEYAALVEAWHAAGVLTHAGYIIGFPHDTPETVHADLRTLKEDIRPDLAAFFMLTPLPGSKDHLAMVKAGVPLHNDFNCYDTCHPVFDHPRMSREAWSSLYQEAWRDFYSFDYMRQQLACLSGDAHTTLLQMYLWYKTSTFVEESHPMMTGFFRLRPRADRRPGHLVDGRVCHLWQRVPEFWTTVVGYGAVLAELQQLWAETERTGRAADRLGSLSPPAKALLSPLTRLLQWQEFLRVMFGGRTRPEESQPSLQQLRPPTTTVQRELEFRI